jgi:hypothetical protein
LHMTLTEEHTEDTKKELEWVLNDKKIVENKKTKD